LTNNDIADSLFIKISISDQGCFLFVVAFNTEFIEINLKHKDAFIIGVISDTHGFLSPGISQVFKGVDSIVHAGDIDKPQILDALGSIAPVIAVRGNMDSGAWSKKLSVTKLIHVGTSYIYLIHDNLKLDLDPVSAGISIVVSGHTHEPYVKKGKSGVLFLNPGSASLPRKGHTASVALLKLSGGSYDVTFFDLGK